MRILDNLDLVIEKARCRVNAQVDLAASAYLLWVFRDKTEYESCLEFARENNLFLLRNHWGLIK